MEALIRVSVIRLGGDKGANKNKLYSQAEANFVSLSLPNKHNQVLKLQSNSRWYNEQLESIFA